MHDPEDIRDSEIAKRAARYQRLGVAVMELNVAAQACLDAGDVICPVEGYDFEDLIHDARIHDPEATAEEDQERREYEEDYL
jgi:hypothetical protein